MTTWLTSSLTTAYLSKYWVVGGGVGRVGGQSACIRFLDNPVTWCRDLSTLNVYLSTLDVYLSTCLSLADLHSMTPGESHREKFRPEYHLTVEILDFSVVKDILAS